MSDAYISDTDLTAYITIEDVVHGVVWRDRKDGRDSFAALICTDKRVLYTRTAANPEPITCLACNAKGWT